VVSVCPTEPNQFLENFPNLHFTTLHIDFLYIKFFQGYAVRIQCLLYCDYVIMRVCGKPPHDYGSILALGKFFIFPTFQPRMVLWVIRDHINCTNMIWGIIRIVTKGPSNYIALNRINCKSYG